MEKELDMDEKLNAIFVSFLFIVIICGCLLASGTPFSAVLALALILIFGFSVIALICYLMNTEEQREKKKEEKEQERIKRNKEIELQKEIAQKTAEITKQNQNIDADIAKYHQLCKQTDCTIEKIKPCKRIIDLFVALDDECIGKIKRDLSPFQKCAEEKAEIESKVKNIAQLYRDIGNPNMAENLIKRLKTERV